MKCTGKEWQHCRVEKMGCKGCYYNKVKVGDYVRTKIGIGRIVKIFEYDDGSKDYYTDNCIDDEDNSTTLHRHQIIKHNENIINLIEPGDYVNGSIVNDINNDEYEVYEKYDWVTKKGIHLECGDEEGFIIIESNKIKSIVTHEQFESASYEVK